MGKRRSNVQEAESPQCATDQCLSQTTSGQSTLERQRHILSQVQSEPVRSLERGSKHRRATLHVRTVGQEGKRKQQHRAKAPERRGTTRDGATDSQLSPIRCTHVPPQEPQLPEPAVSGSKVSVAIPVYGGLGHGNAPQNAA